MQKLELERNPVNEVPASVGPVTRVALVKGSTPRNKPLMCACMDWTSKPKVWISVPDPMKPTPLSSPFSGGGVPHASILGLAGLCESLQAMAATSRATAAADGRRPKVRTMRLSPREVYADGRGKSRTASDARAKARVGRSSAAPAQRQVRRGHAVAGDRHHAACAGPARSMRRSRAAPARATFGAHGQGTQESPSQRQPG